MDTLLKITVLLFLLYSCSDSSGNTLNENENQDIAIRLHALFDELLPERIVSTLIYMGSEMGYDLGVLESNGNILVNCEGNEDCFRASLNSEFIQDYTIAHFPATAPDLEVNLNDDSIWSAHYDEENAIILFQHSTHNIQVEVDAYTGISGGLPMGITPIINGERIEAIGDHLNRRFIAPTEDGGIAEKAIVTLEQDNIVVRFEGGTYGKLFAQGGWCQICDINDSNTIFMEAKISVNQLDKIEINMGGLYYFWFKKSEITTLEVTGDNTIQQYTILPESYFTTYIPDVTYLSIEDDRLGVFDITTESSRLQLESNQIGYPDLWQLDFDHNYKDTGQKSVPTTLIIN